MDRINARNRIIREKRRKGKSNIQKSQYNQKKEEERKILEGRGWKEGRVGQFWFAGTWRACSFVSEFGAAFFCGLAQGPSGCVSSCSERCRACLEPVLFQWLGVMVAWMARHSGWLVQCAYCRKKLVDRQSYLGRNQDELAEITEKQLMIAHAMSYRATTESELADARHPGATTESELAEFSRQFSVDVGEARGYDRIRTRRVVR